MKCTLKNMWKEEKMKMCKQKVAKLKKMENNNEEKFPKIICSNFFLERA
jgi:translation elongation factor EF-1alpha